MKNTPDTSILEQVVPINQNLPKGLHALLKIKAGAMGMTLQDTITFGLRAWLHGSPEKESGRTALAELSSEIDILAETDRYVAMSKEIQSEGQPRRRGPIIS